MSHFIIWLYFLSILGLGFSMYFSYEIGMDYVRSRALGFGDDFGILVVCGVFVVAASLAGAAHALSILS